MASNFKVKVAMLEYGFNQKELGDLLGIDQSQVSRKINGTEMDLDEQKEIIEKMKEERGGK